ncbi:ATP-binding protein [Nocardioides sp. Arc9.136]|uniref:ATP-binding protein n=1 Tax=Nocardioides sp. Arc9.136 TaxID=2996826 RepID=UPI0026660F2D|nr:ATP-binding protein [Nocardioides sp. Arc9.136]WKN50264.1 ATP-binding protein [Nocardioides sp. Arc9.136]
MTDDRPPGTAHRHLTAPAVPDTVDRAHQELELLWAEAPLVGDLDRMRFELAVIEVLANVVEHAYGDDREDPADGAHGARGVDLDLAVEADRLVAVLHDDGIRAELDLSRVSMPGEDAESGRGLALTLATVDELEYRREDGRNLWRLVCLRQD